MLQPVVDRGNHCVWIVERLALNFLHGEKEKDFLQLHFTKPLILLAIVKSLITGFGIVVIGNFCLLKYRLTSEDLLNFIVNQRIFGYFIYFVV